MPRLRRACCLVLLASALAACPRPTSSPVDYSVRVHALDRWDLSPVRGCVIRHGTTEVGQTDVDGVLEARLGEVPSLFAHCPGADIVHVYEPPSDLKRVQWDLRVDPDPDGTWKVDGQRPCIVSVALAQSSTLGERRLFVGVQDTKQAPVTRAEPNETTSLPVMPGPFYAFAQVQDRERPAFAVSEEAQCANGAPHSVSLALRPASSQVVTGSWSTQDGHRPSLQVTGVPTGKTESGL